jgi:hypothetical protein
MVVMNSRLANAASLFVNTSTPIITKTIPIPMLKYFRSGPTFETNDNVCDKNKPVNKKGMPRPIEYENSSPKAMPGDANARVSMLPNTAPTHGVHPAANAIPKTNDVR